MGSRPSSAVILTARNSADSYETEDTSTDCISSQSGELKDVCHAEGSSQFCESAEVTTTSHFYFMQTSSDFAPQNVPEQSEIG